MHDPEIVCFEVKAPWRRRGSKYRPDLLTFWHHEPEGRDSGTVCKDIPPWYPRSRLHSYKQALWTWRHRDHVTVQIQPWLSISRRFERCAECGRRMNKATRFGTGWDTPGVLHDQCRSLRSYKAQSKTLRAVIEGSTDPQHLTHLRYAYKITPWWENIRQE